jgi:hypothetical protein
LRGGFAVTLALAFTWLVPTLGLASRNAERGVLALIAFGLVAVATRTATLFQVLGIVLVVFHERIFAEFGACDAGALRSLRD